MIGNRNTVWYLGVFEASHSAHSWTGAMGCHVGLGLAWREGARQWRAPRRQTEPRASFSREASACPRFRVRSRADASRISDFALPKSRFNPSISVSRATAFSFARSYFSSIPSSAPLPPRHRHPEAPIQGGLPVAGCFSPVAIPSGEAAGRGIRRWSEVSKP